MIALLQFAVGGRVNRRCSGEVGMAYTIYVKGEP